MTTGLTEKQKLFVEHYCQFADKRAAAIAAGYSLKQSDRAGIRNLQKPVILDAIAQRRAELDRNESTIAALLDKPQPPTAEQRRERIRRQLERLAFSDIRKAYASDGSLLPMDRIDDDTAAAIEGVDIYEEFAGVGDNRELVGHTKKVKFTSKMAALALLARLEGMDDPKIRLTFEGNGANGTSTQSRFPTINRVLMIAELAVDSQIVLIREPEDDSQGQIDSHIIPHIDGNTDVSPGIELRADS
jgi:phage terminase small subunit